MKMRPVDASTRFSLMCGVLAIDWLERRCAIAASTPLSGDRRSFEPTH
jgi:hypothetical protein